MPKYTAKKQEELDVGQNIDSNEDGEEEPEENQWVKRPQYQTTFVVKKPPFPHVTIPSITQDFGASQFLAQLTLFLQEQSITLHKPLTEWTTFPVYRRLHLSLPPIAEVSHASPNDLVIATKHQQGVISLQGIKKPVPAKFSTVLVCVGVEEGILDGPLKGIHIAQVRMIFNLPDTHGAFHELLVYVHWFKPLRKYSTDLGMFQTSFSSQNHQQHASVIPVLHILHSCHLIPLFGRAANPTWVSDTVLNSSPSFYLNPYLRQYDFYHLREVFTLPH
ncbi:hypothetical protein DXG01_014193 [Tephrocybe rancida]|nr:hypothetical protein DXG01_014193 [Tephrocybe rancida]